MQELSSAREPTIGKSLNSFHRHLLVMKSFGKRGSKWLKELSADIHDWVSFQWHAVLKVTPPRLNCD